MSRFAQAAIMQQEVELLDESEGYCVYGNPKGFAIISKTGYMLGVRDASYAQRAWITGDAVPASLTASAVGEHRIFRSRKQ